MNTQEVANQCIALFREGNYEEAHNRFYSDAIESIEPNGAPLEYAKGREAIAEKGKNWQAMLEEVHSSVVSDPIVAENFFSCSMTIVATMKGVPVPVTMDEVCVFEVVDGKVVKEQFFYTPQKQEA